MNYWLIKFAPFHKSWEDILRNDRFEIYSVRNPQARNHLQAMALGDKVFYYHSQEGNCIMGIVEVTETAHQDPTTTDARWVSVTFAPTETLPKPIALSSIKAQTELSQIGLVRQPRLSVMPLTEEEFKFILAM